MTQQETKGTIGFRNRWAWRTAKALLFDPGRRVAARFRYPNHIPLSWCEGRNWGDALSPILVELLSAKPALHVTGLHHHRYLAIGSILGAANERAEVWGSGFIREDAKLLSKPRAVHAVRGPLSRKKLLQMGIECPEIYGDPALLFPCFYNPEVEKQYVVGIVPHYIDKEHPWLLRHSYDSAVKILDIEAGILEFVRQVKSCDVILSSSLHGLICADSYGVPNAWIQLSDAVIGGDFKFRDYRRSIGACEPEALRINENTRLDSLIARAIKHELGADLRKLLLACPFLSEKLRQEVVAWGQHSGGLPPKLGSVGSTLEQRSL